MSAIFQKLVQNDMALACVMRIIRRLRRLCRGQCQLTGEALVVLMTGI